jgi:integrase/recombinase XerD
MTSFYWNHPQVKNFFDYLRLKGVSDETIKRYKRVLGSIIKESGLREGEMISITSAQLQTDVLKMYERDLAPSTIATYVLAIKRFFGYLLQQGYIKTDPSRRLPTPRVGQRLPKVLSIPEIQKLFDAIDDSSYLGRRNKLFFQLSYAAGLRISEATHLRIGDIDWTEGCLRVVGKGDKERRLYLKPFMIEALRSYIRGFRIEDFIFPGKKDGPISQSRLREWFRRYVKASGISKRATPHSLRHSIAVHYLMGGAPISFVQQLLGHENLATTGVYTRLSDPMAKEIALSIPTAADSLEKAGKKTLGIENSKGKYGEELNDWAEFVSYVLEW